jgi:diguanylate cyclase (GGDEF)-like protein/PAS domain S-box-containing protein
MLREEHERGRFPVKPQLPAVLQGTAVALLAVAAIELAALASSRFDSPPPVLALPVVIAAYLGATRAGLACAAALVVYAALRWNGAGAGLDYSAEMQARLVMLGIGLPLTAVLVGFLKNRSEERFRELQRSETHARELHGELAAVLAMRDRILDQSMDMICTANAAGQFTMVSAASERVFGYRPDEMVGRRFMDFVHPDDHERTTLAATRIIAGLHTVDFINRYLRKDGTVLHVMWSSRWCEQDQLMYAVARDYTEQKAVDDERARYVAIIEATTDLVGMSWTDGRVTYLNGAGRSLLGIGADEDVTALRVSDLFSDWAAQLLTGHAANVAIQHGVWTGETELHPRAGAALPVSQIVLAHRKPEGEVEFMSTIVRDISTIKALEARLREEAATDDLTGLFNRRHFMERFSAALHSARRRGHLLAFALCDLDGFKQINDNHGHPIGDQVLRAVGEVLASEIRGEDLVGRYGGDEFCMMFPHVSAADAAICVERVRERIAALAFPTAAGEVGVTMTAGIVDLDGANVTEPMLIEAADQALYRAKAAGRNRIEVGTAALSASR